MSQVFRTFIQKVGSGSHTSKSLTREESATALRMMLAQEATPAQIGAFLIAHRIKRPTSEELAGMLDTYDERGPRLTWAGDALLTVLGTPYDGRSRTAPLTILTALLLATAGCPVVLHGGGCMPTKYGVPLIEIWRRLGVYWQTLSLESLSQVLAQTYLGFLYVPQHFPETQVLVDYRDQIGKRPPLATLELMWAPCAAQQMQLVAGYVHPPTENLFRHTFTQRGLGRFITVKGLEGSCDLPRDRTCIIGIQHPEGEFERLLLHPRDYGFAGAEVPLPELPELIAQIQAVLQGEESELQRSAIWNGGFYLWQTGACPTLEAGLIQAEHLFTTQQVATTLERLQQRVSQGTAPEIQAEAEASVFPT
jgi:anthranilate phosphoribosyltransferase